MHFGYDEHPPNHVHNIKPLVALLYYQVMLNNIVFSYTDGIDAGRWRWPAKDFDYIPPRYMITLGYVEEKNTQIELFAHTFDQDNDITSLTMRYELMCFMLDGTIEYKLISEFDMMPFKIVPGIVDGQNHFIFKGQKKFFISDIQPKFKLMYKMAIRIKNVASTQSNLNNESVLEVVVYHTQKIKIVNDVMIQAMEASTQT